MNIDNYAKLLLEFNKKGGKRMNVIGNILIYTVIALVLLASVLLIVLLVAKCVKWLKEKKKKRQ